MQQVGRHLIVELWGCDATAMCSHDTMGKHEDQAIASTCCVA